MRDAIDRATAREGGWKAALLLTPTHQPKALLRNALYALRRAPEWAGVLGHDDFALRIVALRPPPWCRHADNTWVPQLWTDQDDALCCSWLHDEGIGVELRTAATAVVAA